MVDEEMQNPLSVGHSTYYATEYSPSHHTGNHFTGRSMSGMHHRSVVYMCGNRLAEEIIGIVVAVIISPASVHIVCPASVVHVTYTTFPAWNIATAVHPGRGAPYQAAATRHKMPVVLGGMSHGGMTPPGPGPVMPKVAVAALARFAAFHISAAGFTALHPCFPVIMATALNLCACIETCH